MKKAKLAIFDLDGTLFDTRRANFLSYKAALEPFGAALDEEYFSRECNGKHYKTFVPELLRAAGNAEATITEKTEKVHEAKKRLYSGFLGETKANEHLFGMLAAIRAEYNTALVTTASRKNCLEILDFHKKADFFDLILTAEDVKAKKPAPEGFLKAMAHFGTDTENTLVFEDSADGIKAAESAGATLFVARGFA